MFERLSISTPFQVGPVNAYLAGRTLIDPGPASEEARAALLEKLEERGLAPGDLDRILVTHPHPDHFGLAHWLRETGAEVRASAACADVIADFGARYEYEKEYFQPFFERHGMSAETAKTVTELPQVFLDYAPGVETDRILEPGDTVTVRDRAVEALDLAGHAPGELAFAYEDDGRHAAVGDHLLPDITPNPLLQPPPEPGADRPRVLPAFNRSLERLRDGEFETLLPGHREVVADPAGRIDEVLDAHEERTANVRELVDGPTTALEVMEGLFGDLPVTEYFPGMSEAVGHLDVLEERDEVTSHDRGGMVVYEPA
ncbi:MBL fold hydrolase [Halobacteriales archaeon QS_8_69_26]|nr:MAG: MBL fold hydrolase [Halobacteriales archaeon QS_8_69_26]